MIGLPLDEVQRAAVAIFGRGAPRRVDRIAQASAAAAAASCGRTPRDRRDRRARRRRRRRRSHPVGEHRDALGRQRRRRSRARSRRSRRARSPVCRGRAPWIDAGELLGGDRRGPTCRCPRGRPGAARLRGRTARRRGARCAGRRRRAARGPRRAASRAPSGDRRSRARRLDRYRRVARARTGRQHREEALGLRLDRAASSSTPRATTWSRDRQRQLDLRRRVAEVPDLGVERDAAAARAGIGIDAAARSPRGSASSRRADRRRRASARPCPTAARRRESRSSRASESKNTVLRAWLDAASSCAARVECARGVGGARARLEREQLIAELDVIARELGRLVRAFGRANDRDLGLGAELREDPARLVGRRA